MFNDASVLYNHSQYQGKRQQDGQTLVPKCFHSECPVWACVLRFHWPAQVTCLHLTSKGQESTMLLWPWKEKRTKRMASKTIYGILRGFKLTMVQETSPRKAEGQFGACWCLQTWAPIPACHPVPVGSRFGWQTINSFTAKNSVQF